VSFVAGAGRLALIEFFTVVFVHFHRAAMAPPLAAEEQGIIEQIIANDHVRWWNKPNLRRLYLLLVPFCLFIESTSGFDSSMMNGMQALSYWKSYFDNPKGGKLGLLVACYNLGAISSIPFVAIVSDHLGRRKSIVFGSVIMMVGSIMQGLSQNCKLHSTALRTKGGLISSQW
tara:strand:+ start:3516 stop:4034 length:519 start_codon:yes stop_codon:yes gene_type:complete